MNPQVGNQTLPLRSSHFPLTKCEFCDITLKCDLDVSRHLISETHAKIKADYQSLLNVQDKEIERQLPNKLFKVFQTLKIASVGDLKDLTGRGYFKTANDSQCDIATHLAKKIFEAVVICESKSLDSSTRSSLIQAIKDDSQTDEDIGVAQMASEPPVQVTETTPKPPDPVAHSSSHNVTVTPQQRTKKKKKKSKPFNDPALLNMEGRSQSVVPQPRINSTYVPKLAIVKTEPQDD